MGDQWAVRARRIHPAAELGADAGPTDPDYASSFAVDVPIASIRDGLTFTTFVWWQRPSAESSAPSSHRSTIASNPCC